MAEPAREQPARAPVPAGGLRPAVVAVAGVLVAAVAGFAGWAIASSDDEPSTGLSAEAGADGADGSDGGDAAAPGEGGLPGAGLSPGSTTAVAAPPRIAATYDGTCLLTDSGEVSCWGFGPFTDSFGAHPTPVTLPGDPAAIGVTWLGFLPCVFDGEGLDCHWSEALDTQLGTDHPLRDFAEQQLRGVVALAESNRGSCARYVSGRVACLGPDLGGDDANADAWREVRGLEGVIAIDAGHDHVCAVDQDGGAHCWGDHPFASGDPERPARVPGLDDAVGLGTTDNTTCFVRQGGRVSCLLSDGSYFDDGSGSDPSLVPLGELTDVVRLSAGYLFMCGLHADGAVSCWGDNSWGQLGGGTEDYQSGPVRVVGVADAVDIAAGDSHACALLADGGTTCWGHNTRGQLGDGTVDAEPRDEAVDTPPEDAGD